MVRVIFRFQCLALLSALALGVLAFLAIKYRPS